MEEILDLKVIFFHLDYNEKNIVLLQVSVV